MKRAHSSTEHTASPAASPSSGDPAGLWKEAKVTRKVHACTECQNRKVKCQLLPGGSVCTRCDKKGLKCTVNKTLQTLLEEETEWRAGILQVSQSLQAAMTEVLRTLNLPPLESFADNENAETNRPSVAFSHASDPLVEGRDEIPPARMGMTRENSPEPEVLNAGSDAIVTAPMRSLYEVTRLRSLRGITRSIQQRGGMISPANDLITKGSISEGEAEELFGIFSTTLNHYLWGGIALVHKDLASVRRSSSLLLAAILAVTALHIPGRTQIFDICYSELHSLVRDSMLDRYHTLDEVRGLCIGAFWLSDVSWQFSGHAVRIATELNLHQSYNRAIRGFREHIEGARLWYLLYVCDHHFSIAYGRPPVIHTDAAIFGHENFLQLPGITQADFRLQSQVSLFIILTRVYNAFGSDIEQVLEDHELDRLDQFNSEIDTWVRQWESRLSPSPYISSYPSKGVVLHHRFAKLQLNSLALRGFQQPPQVELSFQRKELANIAVSCAMTVLSLIIKEPSITNALVGVPIYLHTMITYAAVFLLKVEQNWKRALPEIDSVKIYDMIHKIIRLLNNMSVGERHLSHHIAHGLNKMLDRAKAPHNRVQEGKSRSYDLQTASNTASFSALEPGYEQIQDQGQLTPYGFFPTEMYDENYFPTGFFDITAFNNSVFTGPAQF